MNRKLFLMYTFFGCINSVYAAAVQDTINISECPGVDIAENLTLTQSQPITDATDRNIILIPLVKRGAGTLHLASIQPSTYTQGTVIQNGTIKIDSASALGSGALTFLASEHGSPHLQAGADITLPNGITQVTPGTVDTNNNSVTLSGPRTGSAGLTLIGGSQCILSGVNNSVGAMQVHGHGTHLTVPTLEALGASVVHLAPGTIFEMSCDCNLNNLIQIG